jgi:FkbM family methyltransferase
MLIDLNSIVQLLHNKKIKINGVLHVGAHNCEEIQFYNNLLNVASSDIIWMDANKQLVDNQISKGIPNVYHCVVSEKDNESVIFNIANNGQSSSILEFGTHAYEHPDVKFVSKIEQKTITLDTFFKSNDIKPDTYDFWNFDIQGAELLALKGANDTIKHAKVLYLEVNEKELYKGCSLIGELDEYLSKRGFKRVVTNMTKHGWGDAIYIRS